MRTKSAFEQAGILVQDENVGGGIGMRLEKKLQRGYLLTLPRCARGAVAKSANNAHSRCCGKKDVRDSLASHSAFSGGSRAKKAR